MADVLDGRRLLALDLAMETPADKNESPGEGEANVGVEMMAEPPVELLHEAALRRSIHDVLDAAAADDDELACVREICQETLSRMNLMTAAKCVANRQECSNGTMDVVADGSDVVKAFTPPKSPQERLVAQNKPRLGRRPSCDR